MPVNERLLERLDRFLDRLEAVLPPPTTTPDWDAAHAFRWVVRSGKGWLRPVQHPHVIHLQDLHNIDEQKARVDLNTRQFVRGLPANNVLLTGARGTGKSSLIKAVLAAYGYDGLRVIEVDKEDLAHLAEIVDLVASRPEKFIVFCDDLSFEADEPGYKALKAVLDGSISGLSANLLVYATSNRRHLMPEYMRDNLATRHIDDEIHPGETIEEKTSLSDRFGLWVSFYPFDQDAYLRAAAHWLAAYGVDPSDTAETRAAALEWSLTRGGRSGRVAQQFARDYAGRMGLGS